MNWSEPKEWVLPEKETFYGNKVEIFEHTILEYNYVTPHLKSKRVVIDIGAHVGSTSVRYSKDFREVKSFEPMYFSELTSNTKHLENITRYNTAISDYEGKIKMYRALNNSGMSRVLSDENVDFITKKRSNWFNQKPFKVDTKPLDFYEFKEVDFIKMDTENYVLPVLRGAVNTLNDNDPILQIECKENVDAVDKFLNDLGFKLYDTFSVERFYKR